MAVRPNSSLRIYYLALLSGGLGCVVLGNVFRQQSGDEFSTVTLIYPGVAAIVGGKACMGVLLYRCWRAIELCAARLDARRNTLDPGAAVALTFVPVVNLVGMFYSLGRLPPELNRLAEAAGLGRRVPEHLGIVAAAMVACTPIPMIGPLIGLVGGLLFVPPLVISCSELADSIESRLDSGQPDPAHLA